MTELERRALLGDKEAQKECTEKGIVLPCPFCGGELEIIGVNNSNPFTAWCDSCGLEFGTGKDYHYYQIIEACNTRQAPPIGRCGECRHSSEPSRLTMLYGDPGTLTCHYGPCNRRNVGKSDYCSYFEPRCEE